jgi:VTC domain
VNFKLRYELKYVLEARRGLELMARCKDHATVDTFGDENGQYEVSSLYYDTTKLRFHFDRQESVGYRRKLRLRSYAPTGSGSCSGLFFEIKEKHKSLIGKKRAKLDEKILAKLNPHHKLLTVAELSPHLPDCTATREIYFLDEYLGLVPTMMIRYLRQSLISRYEPNLRLTLDTRLTAGGSSLTNFLPTEERFILPPNLAVFEIKSQGTIPLWLQKAVAEFKLFRTRYSKYCAGIDKAGNGLVNRPFSNTLVEDNGKNKEYSQSAIK